MFVRASESSKLNSSRCLWPKLKKSNSLTLLDTNGDYQIKPNNQPNIFLGNLCKELKKFCLSEQGSESPEPDLSRRLWPKLKKNKSPLGKRSIRIGFCFVSYLVDKEEILEKLSSFSCCCFSADMFRFFFLT